jgi:hypothetical protein
MMQTFEMYNSRRFSLPLEDSSLSLFLSISPAASERVESTFNGCRRSNQRAMGGRGQCVELR